MFPVLLSAQGSVRVVDQEAPGVGSVWLADLTPGGALATQTRIGDGANGMGFEIGDGGSFGTALAPIGDLDGDGTADLVVGVPGTVGARVGGVRVNGAVWVLFLAPDGSVERKRELRADRDLVAPRLLSGGAFGESLAALGDLDGDGTVELAVSLRNAPNSVVWILSLRADGSIAREQRIAEFEGGFGDLGSNDNFGHSLAPLGDFDLDGVDDLLVGVPGDDDVSLNGGGVWLLLLHADATVKQALLVNGATFGTQTVDLGMSACALGDLDGNGYPELALGDRAADGSVWIVFLGPGAVVLGSQEIDELNGGLGSHPYTNFGAALAPLGDLDLDGIPDLAVGATGGGGGAFFALRMNANGSVKSRSVLAAQFGGLALGDRLGEGLAVLGDVDSDGNVDFAVGAPGHAGMVDADYSTLQAAIDASSSGDTILLRSGSHGPGTIDGQSLTLVAEPLHGAVVGPLRVENCAAGQSVLLRGVRCYDVANSAPALAIENCTGPVWVEDTSLEWAASGDRIVAVEASSSVVMSRVQFASSFAASLFAPTPPVALRLGGGARVHLFDCWIEGTRSATYLCDSGTCISPAGTALSLTSATDQAFLSGGTVRGGTGSCSTLGSRPGGPGLVVAGGATAIVFDANVAGGLAGGSCAPAGPALIGSATFLAGKSLAASGSGVVSAGDIDTQVLRGVPGTRVYQLDALRIEPLYRRAWRGTLIGPTPVAFTFLGQIEPSGLLRHDRRQPPLPPGVLVQRVYHQALQFLPDAAAGSVRGARFRVGGVTSSIALAEGL